MSLTRKKILAIVGGGSVATSVLKQLADEINQRGQAPFNEVLIFEKSAGVGAGMAYQLDSASNLLNTRAGTMSPIDAEPDHFVNWLRTHTAKWQAHFPQVEVSDGAFLPRGLFGLYLNDLFSDCVQSLTGNGVRVEHVQLEIKAMRTTANGYELQAGPLSYLADAVVLATGNLHSAERDHMEREPGYFNSPYPCTRLIDAIPRNHSVCVLGTGLSAIDAVVCLADAGHQGKLIMASRGGRLPSVRGVHHASYSPRLLSRQGIEGWVAGLGGPLTLDQLYATLISEASAIHGAPLQLDSILRSGTGAHRYLDIEVQEALDSERSWQSVLYALNESIDLIWHYLDDQDKTRFEKDFKSQWLAYRVSFPVDNARKLQALFHRDQLCVFGGTGLSWRDQASGAFATSIFDHRMGFRATLYSDSLINSTGFTADAAQCKAKLVRQLLDIGLVSAHPYGGIKVDFHSNQVVTADGSLLPNVYAVGALTSGTHFWTNAMNVNARLAKQVAVNLCSGVQAERSNLSGSARAPMQWAV
ncbi:FAD/NAD(P)-binding protein [Pseudomonas sp. nanlin1]|uniref:FAD/NAD(P)-binding protein n=1 Tax=Pseudomonas sp. nanlin1 TaxID=3040605 RepID=UPI00388F19B0